MTIVFLAGALYRETDVDTVRLLYLAKEALEVKTNPIKNKPEVAQFVAGTITAEQLLTALKGYGYSTFAISQLAIQVINGEVG